MIGPPLWNIFFPYYSYLLFFLIIIHLIYLNVKRTTFLLSWDPFHSKD
jgi:hypothetical protein